MTEEFKSITQYDKSFDSLFTNINHKGFACGFFSVLTVKMFLSMGRKDQETHKKCIEQSMKFTAEKKITYGLNFDDMLKKCRSNYEKKLDICSTSVELIKDNIIGYEHIFENKNNLPYGIIFLKNEKFFVVLYDTDKYYIRDCHNDSQYVCNYSELIKKLKDSYQFENDINLLGDEYINYSSIEYLKLYEPFGIFGLEWVKKGGELYYEKFIKNIPFASEKIGDVKFNIEFDSDVYLKNDLVQYDKQEKIYSEDSLVYF